jgi:hypothetical protein
MSGQKTLLTPHLPEMVVTFDLDAFDNLIRNQGILLKHYRAMRCPVGMVDMYDTRHEHPAHGACSNGFIYELVGEVTCGFLSNSGSNRQQDVGQVDGSTVTCSTPRFYDNTDTPVYVVPFDRFYLATEDIVVVNWQLFEHNVSGTDRLRFPVVSVESLIDNSGNKYSEGKDFSVRNGLIVWDGERRPGFDLEQSKGIVCSVRYRYRPYWYVSSLHHEIRVSQQNNPVTGERKSERGGQQFTLQREYSFESANNDSEKVTTDLRSARFPGDSSFGPR